MVWRRGMARGWHRTCARATGGRQRLAEGGACEPEMLWRAEPLRCCELRSKAEPARDACVPPIDASPPSERLPSDLCDPLARVGEAEPSSDASVSTLYWRIVPVEPSLLASVRACTRVCACVRTVSGF